MAKQKLTIEQRLLARTTEDLHVSSPWAGVASRTIAEAFGVDKCTINRIISRRIWKHIV